MGTDINLISKTKKLKKPILLVGLPGIGLVGKIAVDYLVKELTPKPKLYAKVMSDSFPPAVHTKNSIMDLITNEIYVYSTKTQDYLFLTGPVQPTLGHILNGPQHYEFSEILTSFFKKVGVKEIFTFAGLNIGNKRIDTKKPRVIAITTDEKEKTKLNKLKIKNLNFDKDNKDTLISGVAGLLPGIAYYKYNISGTCIMGETNGKLTFGDHSSAKQVLETIKNIFKLKIDLKKIDQNAKKIEKSIGQITKNIEKMGKKEEAPSNYIR